MRFIPPPEENAVCYSGELPTEYCSLQLPFAEVHHTTGDFGTVISQQIKGNDFAIWKHDFFIKRPTLLYPYVPEGIHTLNYMLKGNIPCELVDVGKVELCENTYNLYYVPPVKQSARLAEGAFSCLHIDLSPDYLQELATEFLPVNEFLKFSTAGNAKIIRATHYPMDGNIKIIIKDIVQCKKTGASRNIYFRSRIYDLLLIFSRDLLQEELPAFEVNIAMLEEIRVFLCENYQTSIKIRELERRFAINGCTLSREFKANFGNTIHQYLIDVRMEKALLLLTENISIKDVATLVGYPDPSSFSRAFRRCFKRSPTEYKSRTNIKD